MATVKRRADLARERGLYLRRRIGRDIRVTREGAGLSIREAAAAVGLSASTFRRIELAEAPSVTVDQLCLACAAVGLKFNAGAYPDGPGVRDAGHGRLLERFRARLPPSTPWRTEVVLPIPGDLRAWDALTELERVEIGIEAEMRLTDAQAVDRKVAGKKRDSAIGIVILLIADTNANRAVVARDRELLRANFPLDPRTVLTAVSAGRAPRASGIVIL